MTPSAAPSPSAWALWTRLRGLPVVGAPTRGDARLPFLALLTSFVVLGVALLGFNRSPLQIGVTVATGCALDVLLTLLLRRAWLVPISACISSLSIALLLNYGHDPWLAMFPIGVTIASKHVLTFEGRHVINPSLFGVVVTLLVLGDEISSSPAYQWGQSAHQLRFIAVYIVVGAIALFLFRVGRHWLVLSFLACYTLLLFVRAYLSRHHIPPDVLIVGSLTTPPFFLFTFFMMTDPRTSPSTVRGQVVIAALVAVLDLVFHARQSLFTFFYAAGVVQGTRFAGMHARALLSRGLASHLRASIGAPSTWAALGAVGALGGAMFLLWHEVVHPIAVDARAPFSLVAVDAPSAGIDLPHDGSLLRAVDERVAHIAKWTMSIGAAVAAGDVDNDGKQDLLFVAPMARAPDRVALFLNRTTPSGIMFARTPLPVDDVALRPELRGDTPLPEQGNGYAAGAVLFDADNDGDLDALLPVAFGAPRLLVNRLVPDGALAFDSVVLGDVWATSVAATVADLDGDARLDVVLRSTMRDRIVDDERGTHLDLFHLPAPQWPGDRRMFAFMHNSWHKADNGGPTTILWSRGPAAFTAEPGAARGLSRTGWTLALSAADLDDDGDTDLYFANDFGPDDLYQNDAEAGAAARFHRVEGRWFGDIGKDTYKGMNSSVFDVDGDERLDIYVSNAHVPMLAEGSLLWLNRGVDERGELRFVDEASRRGALNERRFGWGAGIGDLDLDGWPDIVQGNGYLDDRFETGTGAPSAACPSYWYANHKLMQSGPDIHTYADKWADLRGFCIFPNEQRKVLLNRGPDARPQFIDVAAAAGLVQGENTRGVALVDLDDDGRLDVAMANMLGPPTLLHNMPDAVASARAWIGLDLVGDGVRCNRDAIGTRVEVQLPGARAQLQEKQAMTGLSAESDRRLLFGLGDLPRGATDVDVRVRWCGRSPAQRLSLPVGRYHRVVQAQAP